jgi:hypothetical protein
MHQAGARGVCWASESVLSRTKGRCESGGELRMHFAIRSGVMAQRFLGPLLVLPARGAVTN